MLQDAKDIAADLLTGGGELAKHFRQWKICGSIRREKSVVKDIDIVAIPKPNNSYKFGEKDLDSYIKDLDPEGRTLPKDIKRFLLGPKIKRFLYKGIMIDLYMANEDTFSTLCLIRTGSAEHNVTLTTLARGKGMKLFADGTGLCNIDANDHIINIVAATEDEILMNLLGHIPLPQSRER